jgi:hypothetical protein
MSLGDIGISTINGGAIGVKNAIINGNFAVNQRGVSGTVTLAAGAYGHDRFKAGASGCTYTFATSNNITTLTISSGSLIQVIEGLNLYSGTYTLSWTGTAQGKIGAGSFSGSGVTGAAVGGTNLNIEFNTGTLSLVQFEQGSVATPFERRPFGTELALCQRYAYVVFNSSGVAGIAQSGVQAAQVFAFPVPMRALPTVTLNQSGSWQITDLYVTGHVATTVTLAGSGASNMFGQANLGGFSGLTTGRFYCGDPGGTANLLYSAEL